MSSILTFTLIAFLLVISPGPNGLLIVKTASVHGLQSALRNILGLFSATYIHGALSVFGLSAILVRSSELFMVIKYLGAAYLFYIGIKAIYQSFKVKAEDKSVETDISVKTPSRGFFVEGFLTQLLNPKVSIFYLAAFPQFISNAEHYYSLALLMVVIHASIIATWFTGMALTIQKIKAHRNAKKGNVSRWVQRLSGAVMVYFSSLVVTHST